MEQTTSPTQTFVPNEPIVLSPSQENLKDRQEKRQRSFFATLGLLFAGWLIGNLIIFSLLGLGAITFVGATGLVKVPFVTVLFFGKSQTIENSVDSQVLLEAQKKIDTINSLPKDQTIKQINLSEEEINALLSKQVSENKSFPVTNQKLKILDNKFEFTANHLLTNAPIDIVGQLNVSSSNARVDVLSAKFGKIVLPGLIASNIIDSALSKIGLSLENSQIPARSISLTNGSIELHDVINPNN